jgi:hypothetical protein
MKWGVSGYGSGQRHGLRQLEKHPAGDRSGTAGNGREHRRLAQHVVHEFGGHCLSRLADEYWYDDWDSAVSSLSEQNWPVPYSLNISATYKNPGWKADLLDDDLNALSSLTEKDSRYGRIGVFQGADVSMFNRWRSERISCMIDNRFYFSTWQRMIIVKRIMTLCGGTFDVDSFWAKDDPTDPVRDKTSGSTYGQKSLSMFRTVPTLPSPVLHGNSVEIGGEIR